MQTPRRELKFLGIMLVVGLLALLAWPRTQPPASPANSWIKLADNSSATIQMHQEIFTVEVVTSAAAKAKGLMFRTALARDRGMLFVYPSMHRGGFWMKNTLIPLDIVFIDDTWHVVAIKENFAPCPPDLGDACPSFTPSRTYQYALEVPAGTVAQLRLATGDEIVARH